MQVSYLSRQLGHEDAAFTYRTYVDLFEAHEKAQASRNLLNASGFTGLTSTYRFQIRFQEGSRSYRAFSLWL